MEESGPGDLPNQEPLEQPEQGDSTEQVTRPLLWKPADLEVGKEGMIFTLERILFAVNSYALDHRADSTLLKVAGFLRKNPGVKVIVEGHADETGPDDYSGRLSEQRALAVYRRLIELGIPDSMLKLVAHGEKYPLESLGSGKEMSRRVEIVVLKSK